MKHVTTMVNQMRILISQYLLINANVNQRTIQRVTVANAYQDFTGPDVKSPVTKQVVCLVRVSVTVLACVMSVSWVQGVTVHVPA